MNLTQQEYAALIRMTDRNNVMQCTFGPGFVRLNDCRDNDWARRAVLRMRGIDDETGEQRATPKRPAHKLPPR